MDREIQILPTQAEVLCTDSPWLPCNSANAPHPFQGTERLLDTQFRLLRNDGLQAFFERAQQLVQDLAEGTKCAIDYKTCNQPLQIA